VVVCGPSGVGKGTLLNRLMAEHPESFGFSVSHTTRQPRAGEVDGVHYHFVKKEDMEAAITRGEFIEYARVHSNMYGTSVKGVEDVRAAGKTCLLDIDVQGAELVKKTNLDAVFVFVAPPSYEELERRLRGRGTENEETLKTRLANAQGELAYMYKPGFFDCVIVNDDVEKAYAQFKAVCVPAK
jgi:guanylate kinase